MLQSPYFYTPYKIDGTLKNDQQIQIGLNRQHYVHNAVCLVQFEFVDHFLKCHQFCMAYRSKGFVAYQLNMLPQQHLGATKPLLLYAIQN